MANSNGTLTIGIGANTDDLERGIQDAERQLRRLETRRDDRVRIGADTSQIERQITNVQTHLNQLRTTANATGGALGGMTQQVGNGSNTLMQFSRIAQDAPFGIIGIGNNLTATAEAFGHLRNQTGSAGGALRAMASSLMGTGGILLGVSLLTTGFTLLAQSGLSVGDVIDKITGDFDDFGASVKKAREEGLKSAGKEVESLRELVAVAQNEVISKKDRLVAVEKLQSQFPAYYGNLSKEQIMYGDLTKATHEATKALIAKSVAEKLGDKAGEKFIERLNAQQKFNDAKKKIDDFDKKSEIFLASLKGEHAAQIAKAKGREFAMRNKLLESAEKERQEVIKLENQYSKFGQIIDKLNEQSAPLEQTAPKQAKATKQDNGRFELEKQRLQRIIEVNKKILDNENTLYYDRLVAQKAFSNATISLIDITKRKELTDSKNTENDKLRIIEDAANKTVDAKKELADRLKGIQLFRSDFINDLSVPTLDFSKFDLGLNTRLNNSLGKFATFKKEADSALKGVSFTEFKSSIQPTLPPIALTFTDPTKGFLAFNAKAKVGLTTTEQYLLDFNNAINELANTSIAGAFQSLGDNIGNALANGTNVLAAVGSGLIQALGGFLGELGTRLITYGLLLAGFGKAELAFKVGDPVTKIGAGIAMVALGIAAKGAGAVVSAAGSKGLSGGGRSSSTSSGSTANSSSRVSGGFSGGSGFGGGTVVFEIAGTSLIGVLNNTQARNLRIGGTN